MTSSSLASHDHYGFQQSMALDYLALNDGIDEEVPSEDRIIETPSKRARSSVEPIAPDDSASQLTRAQSPLSVAYQQNEQTDYCLPDAVSISPKPGLSARRRRPNQSLWAQFDSFPLPGRIWHPKRGKGPIDAIGRRLILQERHQPRI